MPNSKEIDELKVELQKRIVTVNIIELVRYYEERDFKKNARIHELEEQLRQSQLNNAENLFRNADDA